jgi:hypothetical protein
MTKKWLIAVAGSAGVVLCGNAIAQLPQCSATTGIWTDYSYWYTWYLAPTASGTVQTFCPAMYPFWNVTGTLVSGNVSMTAASPANDYCPATWFRYNGAIYRGGCNYMDGSWTNSLNQTGSFYMAKNCEVPTGGETNTGGGWNGTLYDFAMTISSQGTSGNLSGRKYREVDFNPAVDGCWFSGSPIAKVTGVSGSVWNLDSTNTYHDYIGWIDGYPVSIYRAHYGSQPCSVTLFQRMEIACGPDPSLSYYWVSNQNLVVTINPTTLTTSRGSSVQSRSYP